MSEVDSSWYLRHRDGVEHGPFQLADLITAAKAGNVAHDTSVRHSLHTRGQWVLAPRIQAIAQAMSRQPESARPTPERPAQASKAQTSPPAKSSPSQPSPAKPSPAQPSSTQISSTQPSETQASAQSVAPIEDIEPTVTLRTFRDDAFPVPKTFLDAMQTLFVDFRFQRFITPWIVEIVWAMSLAVAVLSTLKLGYEMFIEPSVSTPNPTSVRGNWQFEPLEGQTGFLIRGLIFATWGALTTIIILCLRVVFELIIVFFRASGDVAALRKLLKKPRS